MAFHRAHPQKTTWQWLCYSPDTDPRRKEKERTAKNNLATHSRKGEVRSRVAVLERGAHCSARQESMESTCGGPMRHLGTRGQVKWRSLTTIQFCQISNGLSERTCTYYNIHQKLRKFFHLSWCFPLIVDPKLLKCIWHENYFLLIWKTFQNTEEWHFSFWNIIFRFRDIDVFLLCKLHQWWRHIVCN